MKALAKKQRTDNSDWLKAAEAIESSISESHLERLIKETVNDIQTKVAGKKAAFAY